MLASSSQLSELEVGRRAAADDAARLEDDIRQLQRQLSEQGQGRGAGALREERLRAQADELASGKAAAERRWREAQAAGVAATATVAQLTQRLDAFNSQVRTASEIQRQCGGKWGGGARCCITDCGAGVVFEIFTFFSFLRF